MSSDDHPSPPFNLDAFKADTERMRAKIEEQRLEVEKQRLTNEHYRLSLDRGKIELDARSKTFDAIIRFADITLRSLLILNGGAALGFITFSAGKTVPSAYTADGMGSILWTFGIGAALAVLTAGLSYLNQVIYAEVDTQQAKKWGDRFRYLTIIVAISSWVSFIYGAWQASSRLH